MLKNTKKIAAILIIVFIIIAGLYFIFSFIKDGKTPLVGLPIGEPETIITSSVSETIAPYYIKRTDFGRFASSLIKVGSKIYYVSGNSVYSTEDNLVQFNFKPNAKQIDFENSPYIGEVVNNTLNLFNPETEESKTLPYADNLYYSPTFTKKVELIENSIQITNVGGDILASFSIDSNEISNFIWHPLENLVVVRLDTKLYAFNLSKNEKVTMELPDNPIRLKMSDQNQYLSIQYSDYISIYQLDSLDEIQRVPFEEFTKDANFVWVSRNQLILVEKQIENREVDRFYSIIINNKFKVHIADSFVIPSRINLNINPVRSVEGDIYFVNNEGKVWFLTDTLFPGATKEQEDFFNRGP